MTEAQDTKIERLLSIRGAGRYLEIPRMKAWRLYKSGKLRPVATVGGNPLFDAADLDKLAQEIQPETEQVA